VDLFKPLISQQLIQIFDFFYQLPTEPVNAKEKL